MQSMISFFEQYDHKRSFFHFFTLSLFHLITSCVDGGVVDSPVPAYDVRFSCNINTINAVMQQTDLPHLDAQPGMVLVKDWLNLSDIIGVGGLLLYHAAIENAYYAYDLACPYCYVHGKQGNRIEMKDPFTAYCPKCDSEFGAVQYGSPAPTAGPANTENDHLRQYRARLSGENTLVVSRK